MKTDHILCTILLLILSFSPKISSKTMPDSLLRRAHAIGILSDKTVNALADPTHTLRPFLQTLQALQQGKDTTLTIVHLGDSHIQAGYFGGQTMRLLHRGFGNAGRGWLSPLKLARTNEPPDYFITSTTRNWLGGKAVQRKRKCPIGPGGIGVQSPLSSVGLNLIITPKNGAGYGFDQVLLFRDQKAKPMIPTGKSLYTAKRSLGSTTQAGMRVDTFRMLTTSDTLQLRSEPQRLGSSLYYGFLVKKEQRGVLYHSVGVNGAMYERYTDPTFVSRLACLKPSVLIISLGTNESFGRNFLSSEFKQQIKNFLKLVKKDMPQTTILLTTPVECYKRIWRNRRRTYVRNTNTVLIAQATAQLAAEEGIALWDLFSIAGGKGASEKWYKNKLLGRDHIHFSREGYELQGTLLFQAFMSQIRKEGLGMRIEKLPMPTPQPFILKKLQPTLK